jgi:hypothetical protein
LLRNGVWRQDEFASRRDADHANGTASFVVKSDRRLVTVKFGKKVQAADIEHYAARLRHDPSFEPGFAEIADLREVEQLDLQAEEFLRLADKVDPFSHEAKRAFVVRTAIQAHAARMHKILLAQRNFEIFHSLEEAERWIEA